MHDFFNNYRNNPAIYGKISKNMKISNNTQNEEKSRKKTLTITLKERSHHIVNTVNLRLSTQDDFTLNKGCQVK